MTRWIVLNRHLISLGWFTVGSIGLAIMMIINIFLLKRLLESDFKTTSVVSGNTRENEKKTNGHRAHTTNSNIGNGDHKHLE